MKILVVSDEPSPYLWSSEVKEALSGIDLILGCGDLPAEYLEYLTTFSNAPVYYIYGNHDKKYIDKPPLGCTCIDGKLVKYKGVRILGLGGSIRYNNESPFQYSQFQMRRRAGKLIPSILRHKGFDILLTHSGAVGIGDGQDKAHQGFRIFNELIDKWKPKYFIHGHTHLSYSRKHKRMSNHNDTKVVNAYERYIINLAE